MESLRQIILSLTLSTEEKEALLKELKVVQKAIDSAEFRYKRTLMDKTAITNILNASLEEIEKQKAVINKQKKEATNRASIDRVRAEIASMRTKNDLEKITPLIWNELTILNIPFVRSGVVLVHEEEAEIIGIYLATPEGKAIASFQIPAYKTAFTRKIFSHWKTKQILIDQWDEKIFSEWANSLLELGVIESAEKYLANNQQQNLYLHFLPFAQGMLYVGNTALLPQDELNLVGSLADAFSTAYARYEDFNKLEAAKKQVDITLNELQATQKQLIQSEKMASLGELTAGVAHEIQNPLNFVNNFSEINKEMLEELYSERLKPKAERDDNLENEIINNVINNEEKINHHGKRADAIVKSMLQHSRQTKAIKEPTDINALCDEYLRLSFHGMRAKDKLFNADFKTEFDNSIEKINIVPQDMGRVLLNLFNNAFYAVNEKKKLSANNYQPLAEVKTRRINDKVEIVVSDNGNGIPQNIIDKIFQPFFTTKPTGQGTGLGLSLAYDIITKEHNGSVKTNSKENEGAEFIIQLPIT